MQVSQYLHENRWRQRPCSPAMNMMLSASGRVPREGSVLLWRTTLLARSSELYLPAHGGRERWMRLMGQPAFVSARAEDSASCSERNASPDEVRGRSDRSQIVPRTVCREVYKALVPPQRSNSPGFRILFPVLVSKLPLTDGSISTNDTKTVLM